jgi:hypothetical protein
MSKPRRRREMACASSIPDHLNASPEPSVARMAAKSFGSNEVGEFADAILPFGHGFIEI